MSLIRCSCCFWFMDWPSAGTCGISEPMVQMGIDCPHALFQNVPLMWLRWVGCFLFCSAKCETALRRRSRWLGCPCQIHLAQLAAQRYRQLHHAASLPHACHLPHSSQAFFCFTLTVSSTKDYPAISNSKPARSISWAMNQGFKATSKETLPWNIIK